MIRTVEAIIDERGIVRLQEPLTLTGSRRVLVTILEEPAFEEEPHSNAMALLSEAALAEDWNRPEEDAVWSHLQPAQGVAIGSCAK